jgi:hypothetical protein
MEFRNGVLLQLVEGIESTQNEVKRKMIEAGACNDAPKSHARRAREKSSRAITTHSHLFSHQVVSAARTFQKTFRCEVGAIARREPSRSFPPSIMRDEFQRRIA